MPDILSREDILSLLGAEPPLVENLCDVAQQLQPNGIDLTARELFTFYFSSKGIVTPIFYHSNRHYIIVSI